MAPESKQLESAASETRSGLSGAQEYLATLDRIHLHLLPRTYLEIGVWRGHSLSLALPGTRVVAIDPTPLVSRQPRTTTVFPMTSDAFFESYDLTAVLGGAPDLAFLDGMHLFEFALRDFTNVEAHCHKDSVVLIHDCYPIDRESAQRERTTPLWTGDVWKIIPCLRTYRPDLRIAVADVPPSGIGIVTGLDPTSRILRDNYAELCDEFSTMSYDSLESRKAETLARVDGDWTAIRSILPREPFRSDDPEQLRARRQRRIRSQQRIGRSKQLIKRSPLGPLVRRLRRRARS